MVVGGSAVPVLTRAELERRRRLTVTFWSSVVASSRWPAPSSWALALEGYRSAGMRLYAPSWPWLLSLVVPCDRLIQAGDILCIENGPVLGCALLPTRAMALSSAARQLPFAAVVRETFHRGLLEPMG